MPLPTQKPAGLVVDPNWASAANHPCHSLAGTLKAALVISSDGVVYDATGLNTLTGPNGTASPLVDANGFVASILPGAATNAVKNLLSGMTVIFGGALTSRPNGFTYAQTGTRFLTWTQPGGPHPALWSGIGDHYGDDVQRIEVIDGGGANPALLAPSQSAVPKLQTPRMYAAVFGGSGTMRGKCEVVTGTALPRTDASEGGFLVSGPFVLPTAGQPLSWLAGSAPDANGAPASEARCQIALVFGAEATEAQADYLMAHPDEMLMAPMVMSPPPPPPPPPPAGGGTPDPTAPTPGIMEPYFFPVDGYPLRDTAGVVVTDAQLTILGVMDCKLDGPIKDNAGVSINIADPTAISVEYAMFGGANIGLCCAMYDVQRYGDGHLAVHPVKAGHTFYDLVVPLKARLASNDIANIQQSAVDALNASSDVLTAATAAQTNSAKVASAFTTQGAAVVLAQDAVSNITNAIPTLPAIVAGVIAAMKTDPILSQTFNRTLEKETYNQQTHVISLLNDDGTPTGRTVNITIDPITGVVTSRQ